ncbi:MAG: YidH family protein [Dissulfurispiraceae bacterium]
MPDLKDPRIFFAAERTVLAWIRTSIAFMGFGFLIERFGTFVHVTLGMRHEILQRGIVFWVSLIFVLCGIAVALASSF